MRLTLRTLLAYLDDILEPADARDLGKKIEESEFASGLVHRIRSVTRKQRLGAPKLSGKGMGLDANTVAEYLDNTLPQERVPDFEKVCLESDVHLAEVASCHQILTLVLGEPADVDPALSERIRSLQARIDALDDQEPPPPQPVPPAVAESPPPEHRQSNHDWEDAPEAPLVTPASMTAMAPRSSIRLLPVVATLVVAFLLALAALIAMGPLDGDHPILGSLLADAAPAEDTAGNAPSAAEPVPETAGTKPRLPAADESGTEATDTPGSAAQEPTQSAPGTDDGGPGETASDSSTFPAPPINVKTEPTVEPVPSKPEAGTKAMPRSLLDPDPRDSTPPGTVMAAEGTATEPEPGAAAEPKPLARCLSNLHVLARFDTTTETWLRLTANDPIAPQQELVALPTYRPQIAFSTGVQLMLIGPAAVSLRDPGPDGVPGLVVHYGRILASTDGSPDATLNVQFGARVSHITFPGLDSSLALDVQRYHEPGTNPEEQSAHWLIQARATAGQLGWQDQGAADAMVLEGGSLALMIDTAAPQLVTDSPLPEWLDAKNMRPIDRDASEQLEPLLELKRPLTTSLLEQTTNRLIEVRTLAMRSLCLLGTYDSFLVTAFNSKTYRTFWPDLLLALQISVARDADSATLVRTTLERLRGEEGSQLYRFLWGFSPQQLADGEAATLVEALVSPSMDIRVFAYENLNHIVEKTNSYQPEVEPTRQRRAILNWQRDLKQNTIAYKNPPLEVDK